MNDISIRLEVKEKDARKMISWLDNKTITKYLNEDINSVESIKRVMDNNQSDLFTYYLNQDGRFFLIDLNHESIGFINLFTIRNMKEYEVVVAIGDETNWGRQYAKKALEKILREVFLSWRIERLQAKICMENTRSIALFEHLKFSQIKKGNELITYSISFNDYMNGLLK